MKFPSAVKIVEVGPRDGLQNEKINLDASIKIELINRLGTAGFAHIEVGSFVSPKWVPQMADTDIVMSKINRVKNTIYSALVPNEQGLKRALQVQADEIAIFAAASETFSQKNINCSIKESLLRFEPVVKRALQQGIKVRAYISCALGCPYEGNITTKRVETLADNLLKIGATEISLGDTIGVGTPAKAAALIRKISRSIPLQQLAVHFHDTYGQALANILAVLDRDICIIDSAIAGLGGCPYAKGANGNVATEDVLYMLEGLGISTGVNLSKAMAAGNFISQHLGRPNLSKVASALS